MPEWMKWLYIRCSQGCLISDFTIVRFKNDRIALCWANSILKSHSNQYDIFTVQQFLDGLQDAQVDEVVVY